MARELRFCAEISAIRITAIYVYILYLIRSFFETFSSFWLFTYYFIYENPHSIFSHNILYIDSILAIT